SWKVTMAKCTRCSAELPSNAAFCPQCSQPVSPTNASGSRMGEARAPVTAVPDIDGLKTALPVDDTSSELPSGTSFHDRYTLDTKLGAGGMGVVYLATDAVTKRQVALKLIKPLLLHSDQARQRFLREGLIARDIRHRNIIAVYDVGEAEGQFYLVMEYLPGETL